MRITVVQMQSGSNLEENLGKMETFTSEAAKSGATFVAFPELAYLSSTPADWRKTLSLYPRLKERFSELARRLQIFLSPGSLREPVPGDETRCFNTALLFDPKGQRMAEYRKIFLFRANLPDRNYDESLHCAPGDQATVVSLPGFTLGFSICYDIRFPELFRNLRQQGADLFLLPASFTVPTGTAHWDILTRARAIENGSYLVAAAQCGTRGDGMKTFGHSRIISPWGEVLAEQKEGEGIIYVSLSPQLVKEARSRVDSSPQRTVSSL